VVLKLTYGRVEISAIKSAFAEWKRKYYEAMKRLMRDAAGVFVKSAVTNVAVDTGMSAASLEPMAKVAKTSILPYVAPKRVRRGVTAISGRYYPKKIKGIPEGVKAGLNAFKFNYGSIDRPTMSFRFQIKVWQYWYWEPQWQSLNEAMIDAEIFIENNYEKYLPDASHFPFKFRSKVNY
jgi:hypothetical protein